MSNIRLTKEYIESCVKKTDYIRITGTTVTVCCITLRNGYQVIGHSACVDPANYDSKLGEMYSREMAIGKIWELEGYLLKERSSV